MGYERAGSQPLNRTTPQPQPHLPLTASQQTFVYIYYSHPIHVKDVRYTQQWASGSEYELRTLLLHKYYNPNCLICYLQFGLFLYSTQLCNVRILLAQLANYRYENNLYLCSCREEPAYGSVPHIKNIM